MLSIVWYYLDKAFKVNSHWNAFALLNAEAITQEVKTLLQNKKLQLLKLTGCGTDGANVMVGKNKGFF